MNKKAMVLITGVLIAAGGAAAVAGVGEKRGRFGHEPSVSAMFARMGGPGFGRGMGLKGLDADGDGAVTIEEALVKRAPLFTRIDTNGDGVIDSAEIEAETNLNVQYWTQAMMHRLDRDSDGKITKEEFGLKDRKAARGERADDDDKDRGRRGGWWHRHHHGHAMHGPHRHHGGKGWHGRKGEHHLMRSFEKFDLNSDGVLEASEIETGIKPQITRKVSRMMKRFDLDNDGRITREEFEKPTRDRFAMRDINKDGKITEDDLPPMMRGRGILR